MIRNILVADADVNTRDRLYETFSMIGHTVECVPTSKEIMVRLQDERPFLIILNQDIHAGGGIKAIEEIKKFDNAIKVVLLTKEEPSPEILNSANALGYRQ